MLKVSPFNSFNFAGNQQKSSVANPKSNVQNADMNPVSKKGERLKLARATFIAGLGFGLTMLAELFDGGFTFEHIEKQGKKLADKNYKNASKNKKELMTVLSSVGLLGVFIGGCAFLYTLFKTPKIMYDGKVNAFTKGKEMDVYIKGNSIEKDLYTQMNEKAKGADEIEKEKLKAQYLKMQVAKNRLPSFIESLNRK